MRRQDDNEYRYELATRSPDRYPNIISASDALIRSDAPIITNSLCLSDVLCNPSGAESPGQKERWHVATSPSPRCSRQFNRCCYVLPAAGYSNRNQTLLVPALLENVRLQKQPFGAVSPSLELTRTALLVALVTLIA